MDDTEAWCTRLERYLGELGVPAQVGTTPQPHPLYTPTPSGWGVQVPAGWVQATAGYDVQGGYAARRTDMAAWGMALGVAATLCGSNALPHTPPSGVPLSGVYTLHAALVGTRLLLHQVKHEGWHRRALAAAAAAGYTPTPQGATTHLIAGWATLGAAARPAVLPHVAAEVAHSDPADEVWQTHLHHALATSISTTPDSAAGAGDGDEGTAGAEQGDSAADNASDSGGGEGAGGAAEQEAGGDGEPPAEDGDGAGEGGAPGADSGAPAAGDGGQGAAAEAGDTGETGGAEPDQPDQPDQPGEGGEGEEAGAGGGEPQDVADSGEPGAQDSTDNTEGGAGSGGGGGAAQDEPSEQTAPPAEAEQAKVGDTPTEAEAEEADAYDEYDAEAKARAAAVKAEAQAGEKWDKAAHQAKRRAQGRYAAATQVRAGWVKVRPPEPDELALANSLTVALRKARIVEPYRLKQQKAVPPGRVDMRQAMLRKAQRSMRATPTAQPFVERRVVRAPDPPLVVGYAVDSSGSMGWAMPAINTTAYALGVAVHKAGGTFAAVAYGGPPRLFVPPGSAPRGVTGLRAAGGDEQYSAALRTLDGVLGLSHTPLGARVIFVFTDGDYLPSEGRRAVQDTQYLASRGVTIVWITDRPENVPPGAHTIHHQHHVGAGLYETLPGTVQQVLTAALG